jgi:hypothetical protein
LSKQSNQRYRKEKEAEHLKKANIENSALNSNNNASEKDKTNREFDAPASSSDK